MTATVEGVIATGVLVRVREKRLDDAALDYEWRKDPELAAYDAAHPLTMSRRSFVATISAEIETPVSHRRSYSIDTLDDDRHIGNLMYYGYDPARGEAELGITIGDRAYWSRGYGSDALKVMLVFLFEELGLKRVYLHTLTWNDRAQQAFTRAGFSRVREVHRGGHDFVLMEVLREQYEAQRAED